MNKNTVWHKGFVTREGRNGLNGHGSGVIWFSGLSASGKSTIAHHLELKLHNAGIRTYVFDGDNIRRGLNANLGFSKEDREENIRRIVEVCKLFVDAGMIVLAAFITPLKSQREFIHEKFAGMNFVEVYVKCDVEECMRRDPKGLYAKARAGLIADYTGVSSPFEEPEKPHLVLETQKFGIEELVISVFQYLKHNNFFAEK